tara:strand:- start:405 stop:1403 length:999 start_codon:yes stop_codon:yes gene_type:complete
MYFIAEIGVNHNGDTNIAKELIDCAKDAGADAVKFQTFSAKKLALKDTPKTKYQKKLDIKTDSHYQMLKRLELSKAQTKNLFNYCAKKKIDFISTPYDVDSAKFLNEIGCRVFKTAAADLVDVFLHEYLSKVAKKVIISVGMSSLGEIEECLKIYESTKVKIVLLHCVSNYPCSDESLNLNVIKTLKLAFDCQVGLSDHSEGYLAGIIACSLGSEYIEKHFTLDRNMEGPDHKASSTPAELKELIKNINRTKIQLGSTIKKVQHEELDMLKISRKSIYACKDIKKGEQIKKSCLKFSRPGGGINPQRVYEIVGKKASKNITKNEKIKNGDFD